MRNGICLVLAGQTGLHGTPRGILSGRSGVKVCSEKNRNKKCLCYHAASEYPQQNILIDAETISGPLRPGRRRTASVGNPCREVLSERPR